MWIDESMEFADATSVGAPNNTTVNVGDVMDTGAVARDLGNGEPFYLVIQVVSAITSGGSATVRFKLATDAASTLEVDGTQTEHITSDSIPVASLVAGYLFSIPLPQGSQAYERYMGVQVQEAAGQALTGGTINAFLTQHPANWVSHADNAK